MEVATSSFIAAMDFPLGRSRMRGRLPTTGHTTEEHAHLPDHRGCRLWRGEAVRSGCRRVHAGSTVRSGCRLIQEDDCVGGLEVLDPAAGEFVPVDPLTGTFLDFTGSDSLISLSCSSWTSGRTALSAGRWCDARCGATRGGPRRSSTPRTPPIRSRCSRRTSRRCASCTSRCRWPAPSSARSTRALTPPWSPYCCGTRRPPMASLRPDTTRAPRSPPSAQIDLIMFPRVRGGVGMERGSHRSRRRSCRCCSCPPMASTQAATRMPLRPCSSPRLPPPTTCCLRGMPRFLLQRWRQQRRAIRTRTTRWRRWSQGTGKAAKGRFNWRDNSDGPWRRGRHDSLFFR